jgi:hypothetical protein
VDEARTVIRRLERIEALRSSRAPAEELLGEVRQLLAEGEAWLAVEHPAGVARNGNGVAAAGAPGTEDAAAALADCRRRLSGGREVMPRTTGGRDL